MYLIGNIVSRTHKRYYSNLSVDLKKQAEALYPRRLTMAKLKDFDEKYKEKTEELPTKLRGNLIYFSVKDIEKKLSFVQKINFSKLFNSLSPIISTNLYLNPGKKIKILFKGKNAFVVCVLQDPIKYLLNMYKVKKLIEPLGNIFSIDTNFVLIREGGKNYLITNYHGKTLEDSIKEQKIKSVQKTLIVKRLAALNKLFSTEGVIFGGFAPRNFLFSNEKIYIIDFEDLHRLNNLSYERIKYIQDIQTICFSDVFNTREIKEIFQPKKLFYVPKDRLVTSDNVERAYFKKSKITQEERDDLWKRTRKIERAIVRKNKMIYGHNLGQFFSDNFSPRLEAQILKQFYSVGEKAPDSFKDIMLFLDYWIDFYNENNFRKFYNKDIDFDLPTLIVDFLNKLESSYENVITLIRFFNEMDYFDKNNSFVKRKNIIDLFRKTKTKTINNDFSKVFLFNKYAFKTVYSAWRDEVKKIDIINKIYPNSPERIKVYSYMNYSTIIYKNYGTSNLSWRDSAEAAKLLAQLHNVKINKEIGEKLKSKYVKFDKYVLRRICKFLLKLGYDKKKVLILHKNMIAMNKALSLHPKSIVHNDLYYDQFHKNSGIRLLDWTFAAIGSPFMDLSSILRNDYDSRNMKLNKKLFLKEYLKESKFRKDYSKKMLEEGFYINCVRDIIWFIERINLGQTRDSEVYTWLKDAFEDLIRNRFVKFYPGLF